jgi:TorA maturation chaperone TorD
MDTDNLELAPLLARRDLWLLVSAAFTDPYNRERFELLFDPSFRQRVIEATTLTTEEHTGGPLGFGEEEPTKLSPRHLFAALDAERETIDAVYRQVFGMSAVSEKCPPCEIEWEPNAEVAFRSQVFADLAGFYQAFGLEVSPSAGERLDHVTIETEFLYVLLAKEAVAMSDGNQEGIEICRDARRKFFHEHVGWWLPAFSQVLARLAPTGFYYHLAKFTAALTAAERMSLELAPFSIPVIPKPSEVEAEAGCFNCS